MVVIQAASIPLILLVAPLALGIPWTQTLPSRNRYRLLAALPMGFFTELAIFLFLAVPFGFLQGSFSLLCILFAVILLLCCGVGIAAAIRTKPVVNRKLTFSGGEYLYLIIFLVLLGWQMYNGLVLDPTYWTYDDAGYIGYAADALRFDKMQVVNESTGLAQNPLTNATRLIQSSLYFPAMLSFFSAVPVTTMERTILEVYNIMLAYTVYAYMASVIWEKKENGLIFLIILSVLHIYGYYSQYSITFRLLGPNYQGKAVLAASLVPFLFTYLIQILQDGYDRKSGAFLLIVSAAAVSLTLFGVPAMMMNSVLVIVLSIFRKQNNRRYLLYIPWACALPVIYGCIYFIYRYYKW